MLFPGDVIGHRFSVHGEPLAHVSPPSEQLAEQFSLKAGATSTFEVTRKVDTDSFAALHVVSELDPRAAGIAMIGEDNDDDDDILRFYGPTEYYVQCIDKLEMLPAVRQWVRSFLLLLNLNGWI